MLLPHGCTSARFRIIQYASATLVYDPRLLSADPELRGFVKDRAADHPALKLQVNQIACWSYFLNANHDFMCTCVPDWQPVERLVSGLVLVMEVSSFPRRCVEAGL